MVPAVDLMNGTPPPESKRLPPKNGRRDVLGSSQQSKTAAAMREKARRLLEAGNNERDLAARKKLHQRALKLAVDAEMLDGPHAASKPAA
jgi:hypothetical protein